MDNVKLARWRSMNAADALRALAEHVKQDTTFSPRASEGTTRWHASVAGHDVEVVCKGPKFFDTRARRGGAGAVDLVMHLFGIDFKEAVKLLREHGL